MALIFPLIINHVATDSMLSAFTVCISSIVSVVVCVYFIGIDGNLRVKIKEYIKQRTICLFPH
jgi:hypothetical protein